MTIRVLVVDDHPVVRDGLRGMFTSNPDFRLVGDAANGHQATSILETRQADVVIMDLRMPGISGVEATRRIREAHPRVHVLVLTTFDDDQDIRRAIDAGATGYLLKDAPREELFDAVRRAARGETVLAASVATRLVHALRRPDDLALTEREVDVLRCVAEGLTNRAIGERLHVSEATVKTHLVNAYAKLGVDDRTAAVMAALERGVLDRPS